MNKFFCEKCNQEQEYFIKKEMIESYKGKIVNIIEDIPVCKVCGEELFIDEIESQNLKRLYNKYREITGIIGSEEIINFRNKYNISQRELVSILGWGKMTINRYERGSLPSQSHSDVLKNIKDNEEILIQKLKEALAADRINEKVFNKIMNNVQCAKNESSRELAITILNRTFAKEKDIYNGYTVFDVEKLENLISYIADNVDNLFKTSLNKYLWYIDVASFKERVKTITGLRYMKLQYGPVIESRGYEKILDLLEEKFVAVEYMNEIDSSTTTKIKSNKNYDMSSFSKSEIDIINKVINKFKNMRCGEISDKSHEEDGWLNTSTNELISFDYAESLKMIF